MVPDNEVAYHAGWVNSWSLGIEQVGFAAWSRQQWIRYQEPQLYRVASQIATWCEKYDIPFKLSRYRGICQHNDVSGLWGHWDCGPGYPIEYVILWAELIHHRRKPSRKQPKKRIRQLEARIRAAQRRYGIKRPDTKPW
jgi:N-acetyl-anhydromuramyl-L-alanine amidase AmpD